ncbi:MAG TPA: FAD-dependent oxidoreductase, partial [Stellaceae bacterium]|nr:FAD-dependent oxidoreductase [Stellaceae bacterium]
KEIARLEAAYIATLQKAGVTIVKNRAVVADAHIVQLANGERIRAAYILIATGGAPTYGDPIPGIEHAISSNEAFHLPQLPQHVVIQGGGYIAVEFAGIFASLGAEVTIMIRGDEILRGFDDDIRLSLTQELRARGLDIHSRSEIARIEKRGTSFVAHTAKGDELAVDLVMYATGRKPNTRTLGLAELGIACNEVGAVPVDEWSRTSIPHIYAIGDVTDRLNLTPVAIAEGRAIAETLFNDNPMKVDHANVATAVFSQPPVGTVGLTERQAREKHDVEIYRTRFRPMKHTLTGREERTMMKLVVDRPSNRVLGCHMVGADAPEIIQGLAIAVKCGATKKQFDQTIGIHPTAAEEFVTMRDKVPDPVPAQ